MKILINSGDSALIGSSVLVIDTDATPPETSNKSKPTKADETTGETKEQKQEPVTSKPFSSETRDSAVHETSASTPSGKKASGVHETSNSTPQTFKVPGMFLTLSSHNVAPIELNR